MKIAITGGTGFIGRHLAHDLVQRGHQVVLIARGLYARGEQVRSNDNLTFVLADVTDTASLIQAFDGCTAVVQCAGTSQDL
jgi:nucleoside-diphosphate-sugar epimerase